jgi:glycosyltransferase involved in cell wall biosynthesis
MKEGILIASKYHPGIRTHFYYLSKKIKFPFYLLEEIYNETLIKILKRIKFPVYLPENISKFCIYILGGWHPFYYFFIKKLKNKKKKVGIYWTSTIGQSEMTPQFIEIKNLNFIFKLMDEKIIDFLIVPIRTHEALKGCKNIFLLPHTMDLKEINYVKKEEIIKKVDLFFGERIGKNIVNQFLGAYFADPEIEIYTNLKNKDIIELLSHLKIPFKKIDWIPSYKNYLFFISQMGFSLQITYTESFNYAVAERMAIGIPVFVSPNIFLIYHDKYLRKHLCIEIPDSPYEISKKLKKLIMNKNLYKEINSYIRIVIENYLKKTDEIFEENFKKLINFLS